MIFIFKVLFVTVSVETWWLFVSFLLWSLYSYYKVYLFGKYDCHLYRAVLKYVLCSYNINLLHQSLFETKFMHYNRYITSKLWIVRSVSKKYLILCVVNNSLMVKIIICLCNVC